LPFGNILVIAPNPEFRRSLAFALETEGYSVETEGEIPSRDELARFGAIVLDHKAIRQEPPGRSVRVGEEQVPVILLASRPEEWSAQKAFRTIPTPLMGSVLSDAVAAALAATRAHLS
jgi:DNA-binding response OmpR family regulator